MRRYARAAVVILALAAVAAAALWPSAMEVELTRAVRGPLQVTIDEDGQARVQERFVVSAPVAGRLQRIELEPGDPVVRGSTVLARLDPAESPLLDPRTRAELAAAAEAARAAVGQARAEQDRTATALGRAETALRRQETLAKAGAVSRDDLDASQAAHRSAEGAHRAATFAVARAEQEAQLARARLQSPASGGRVVQVVAPVDGVVLRRLHESESVVPVGEPLLEIGDPQRLEVIADLLSTDAVRISPGQAVSIEQWGGGKVLEARVRRVEPSAFLKVSALGVEEQRVNVVMDFADRSPGNGALGDGYRVEVRIVVWQRDDVLKVPVGSLFRHGRDWAVFRVRDGRAMRQIVTLGQRNNDEAEIIDGLGPDDVVVLHPPDTLEDGMRVSGL